MFIDKAYANTALGGIDVMQFLPMVVIFVLFWFLLVRPQQKRMKDHQKMLSEVVKGDDVTTSGGIIGRVVKAGDDVLTVEIAQGVEIQVQRAAIASKLEKGTYKAA